MITITLQQIEIKKFLDMASYVKTNQVTLMPMTEYIKLEINRGIAKMTLSNEINIIIYSFQVESSIPKAVFLVSYLELVKYFKEKRGNFITIKNDEDKLTQEFNDGDLKVKYKIPDEITLTSFPKIPEIPKSELFQKIDKQTISILNISKKFALSEAKDKLRPILNNVNIFENKILSSDGNISFLYLNLPIKELISFSTNVCNFISSLDFIDCFFSTELNWIILKYKTIIFCERLSELSNPEFYFNVISGYIPQMDKTNKIKISVKGFADFCKSSIPYIKDETVNSKLILVPDINGKLKCELSYSCEANISSKFIDNAVEKQVDCEVVGYEKGFSFYFNQKQIMKVLDGLNKDVLNISECIDNFGNKNFICFWLDDEENFYSICSKGIEPQKMDKTEIL